MNDIWSVILDFTDCGDTLKSLRLTSKRFYLYLGEHWVEKYKKPLLKLIEKYPNKPWKWYWETKKRKYEIYT